jgi:membrane-associated phospholipid phosphatase
MRAFFVAAAAAVLVATPAAGAAGPSPAHSGAVQEWIGVTLDEIRTHATNPPRATRALAHVSAAMYPAAVLGGDAEIDGAASAVLSYLYPDRAAHFASLVAGDPSRVARGAAIGARLVARAQGDGSSGSWTGAVPSGDGLWTPTPPGFLPSPLEPLAGTWRTWNLTSGAQLRPGPPPAYGSAAYAAEIQEVYDVSQSLTAGQKAIALFWADGAGTVTPPGHWNQIALALAADENMSTVQAAKLFATLNTAQADAFIACWDAKFAYWSERPVTAIRREISPTWTSFIGTPPFPSYTSGHSTTSGASATVLSHFFPQARDELAAMAEEAMNSRLYGGIHFASDNERGLALGKAIGREALRGNAGAALVPPA